MWLHVKLKNKLFAKLSKNFFISHATMLLWSVEHTWDEAESYLRIWDMNSRCVFSSSSDAHFCSLCCSRCCVDASSSLNHEFSWHSLRTWAFSFCFSDSRYSMCPENATITCITWHLTFPVSKQNWKRTCLDLLVAETAAHCDSFVLLCWINTLYVCMYNKLPTTSASHQSK